jgi:hypothetical protein
MDLGLLLLQVVGAFVAAHSGRGPPLGGHHAHRVGRRIRRPWVRRREGCGLGGSSRNVPHE